MSQAALLYDGQCRFCRWSAARVLGMDRSRTLRPVDIRSPEGARVLAALDEEERLASWHLSANGRLWSAGSAFPPLLDRLPFGRLPSRVARALPRTIDGAYSLVARNRGYFGRLVSAGADRRAQERLAERSSPRADASSRR